MLEQKFFANWESKVIKKFDAKICDMVYQYLNSLNVKNDKVTTLSESFGERITAHPDFHAQQEMRVKLEKQGKDRTNSSVQLPDNLTILCQSKFQCKT